MKQKRKKFRQQMALILTLCMISTIVPADMALAGDLSDGTGEVMQQSETFSEEDGLLQEEVPEQENQKPDVLQPEVEMLDGETSETMESEAAPQDVLTGDTEELLLDDSSEEEMLSAGDEIEETGEANAAGQVQAFAARRRFPEADLSGYGTADVAKTCNIYQGDNIETQDYINWSTVIDSYLVPCSDGSIMRIQNGAVKGLLVEYYDASYNFKKSLTVALELPIFGGFYETGDYYYVLTGQNNPNQSDSVEVFRVTKYTKSWRRVSSCGLYGANTTVPFDAGSARMASDGKYLMIRTCHEMYKSGDGLNHQANVTVQVDTDNMIITDSHTEVAFSPYGYVSHSFNQFIESDNGNIVTVDHGDAYPRKIVLYKNEGGSNPKEMTMFSYPGTTGDNYTGASAGSFQISDTSYLVAGNYDAQLGDYDTRRVFISAVPKEGGAANVIWYSDYQTEGGAASTPYLVKLGNNSFMLMWSCQGYVYYTKVNGNGQKVGSIYKMKGNLSDCEPQVINGKVIWYTWKNERNVFYEINVNDPSKKYVAVIDNGHSFTYGNADKNGNITGTCSTCGRKKTEAAPVGLTSYWNFNEGYFWFEDELPNLNAGDILTFDINMKYASDNLDKNREIEVVIGDRSIADIKEGYDPDTREFSVVAKKTDRTNIIIRAKRNPKVQCEYTVGVNDLGRFEASLSNSVYSYNGGERKPGVVLKDPYHPELTLKKDTDYTVTYKNNIKVGTAQVIITGKGNYTGTLIENFTIQRANQKVAVYDRLVPGKYMTSASKRLDSKTLTLKGTVLQGNKTGKFSFRSDNPSVATVTSWGRITFTGVGTARITATTKGSGNYNPASVTFTLTVLPSPTAITKLQSQKPNWLNIQYRANRKADGYQIQYGTSPDMKGAKYAAVNNSAIRSYTRKDVTGGATYYVRVRTFNVVDGKRYYSNWSGIKNMKVK